MSKPSTGTRQPAQKPADNAAAREPMRHSQRCSVQTLAVPGHRRVRHAPRAHARTWQSTGGPAPQHHTSYDKSRGSRTRMSQLRSRISAGTTVVETSRSGVERSRIASSFCDKGSWSTARTFELRIGGGMDRCVCFDQPDSISSDASPTTRRVQNDEDSVSDALPKCSERRSASACASGSSSTRASASSSALSSSASARQR